MKIYNLIPRLENDRILKLWHKAQEDQWSATRIDWHAPHRIHGKGSRDRLARILTPILMGEQSAFHSASVLLPALGQRNEIEAQYYLTTWLVDEARHAELFSRLFRRFDREPLSVRKFPGAYYFQSRVMANDPGIWLAGLLVVEVLAKHVMTEFRRLDIDPCLSDICNGILKDEARHIGFNRIYTEDRLRRLEGEGDGSAQQFADHLRTRLDEALEAAPDLLGSLYRELAEIGFDTEAVLGRLAVESRERMDKAIRAGREDAGAGLEDLGRAAQFGS